MLEESLENSPIKRHNRTLNDGEENNSAVHEQPSASHENSERDNENIFTAADHQRQQACVQSNKFVA